MLETNHEEQHPVATSITSGKRSEHQRCPPIASTFHAAHETVHVAINEVMASYSGSARPYGVAGSNDYSALPHSGSNAVEEVPLFVQTASNDFSVESHYVEKHDV